MTSHKYSFNKTSPLLKALFCTCIYFPAILCAQVADNNYVNTTKQLALHLDKEKSFEAAAIEYRRLGMSSSLEKEQAAYYMAAGYEYLLSGNLKIATKMLDQCEDLDSDIDTRAVLLMRGNLANLARDYNSAYFYYKSILDSNADLKTKTFTSRKLASIYIQNDKPNDALESLSGKDLDNDIAKDSIRKYISTHRKKPWLGGLLGMIPGLGYTYSGEYANAVRSIIINGIFIYGMMETADDENWGTFSAITFFELTWYTGSIYGGIDSAHRYNTDQQTKCIDDIMGKSSFKLNMQQIPIISLSFSF